MLQHIHIINLLHIIKKTIYMVLEHNLGGELLGRILEFGYLCDKESHRLFKQVYVPSSITTRNVCLLDIKA